MSYGEVVDSFFSDLFAAVGVSIRFVDENPVVSENNRTVTICLERLGPSQEDITLEISAEESSPPDARGTKNVTEYVE